MSKPIATLVVLAGLLVADEARAQFPMRRMSTVASAPRPANTYRYSYYASPVIPARGYVAYGPNDFPFHGQPYGHPYDRWTWPYMSGSYSNGLARYYDPPVK